MEKRRVESAGLYKRLKEEQAEWERMGKLFREADKKRISEKIQWLNECDHTAENLTLLGREERVGILVTVYECAYCGAEVEKCQPTEEKGMKSI